jgi:GNAT superfamily N-acetyltransferase
VTRGHSGAPSADTIAAAMPAYAEAYCALMDGAWTRREPGVAVAVAGLPEAALNVLSILGPGVESATLERLLDEVAATGLPFGIEARPGMDEAAAAVAARPGMTPDDDSPLMVATHAPDVPLPAGFAIRPLAADEAGVHARVGAAGFGAPLENFERMITERVLRPPGVRAYVGELDGEPVATAMRVTLGDGALILNVATLEHHRRRGYGAALTARACADALAAGARYAWLQSSLMAESLYAGLGFRTLERWRNWVSAAS